MKKAHLRKWRKECLIGRDGMPYGCKEPNQSKESHSYANGYHYIVNLIPISPAHGGEAGIEQSSEMDHGSLDLSRTGPYYHQQSRDLSRDNYINTLQDSLENVSNSSTPDQQVQSECLDLSQGRRSSSPRSNRFSHFNGGACTELSQNGTTPLNPAFFQYQLPRIKLEPGLGIDPSIIYKPEMDLNHNQAVTSSPLPGTTAISYNGHIPHIDQPSFMYSNFKSDEQLPNGCASLSCDNIESTSVSMDTLTSNLNCIPLTVMSQDDDNDSGTESIDSKDSDASNNLCINGNGSSVKQSDKKRPGRKKGQVSKVYHLWEFIRDVLNDPNHCGKVIKWENEEEGIFRVVQSEVAAAMWGQKKNNRTKMTYEKMSRSIRYSRKEGYFDDLPKDKGYPKKLCFKFGKKAHGWNTKKQSPTNLSIPNLCP